MATILLAIGDRALRQACRAQLEAAGHAVLTLESPLAPLTLARRVVWDAALVDASPLGGETLAVLSAAGMTPAAVIGLGLEAGGLAATLPLPLVERDLVALVGKLSARAGASVAPVKLRLDPMGRVAAASGGEALLTRTEYRLLALLFDQSPREVPLDVILQGVWGFTEGKRTSDLVRAHVRNLRRKLEQIGLGDVVRSRRGRGYALVL